jgi:hypothetical protein
MLTDSTLLDRSGSWFAEFDQRRKRHYPPLVSPRVRRVVHLPLEVIESAKSRGISVGDYIAQLHMNQRSNRVAFVASIYRGFALLEMARVPVDPAYYELVEGVLGENDRREFQIKASSGESYALAKASARLLGADTRQGAIEAVLLSATRAQVPHEGFIEAARLLEATFYR